MRLNAIVASFATVALLSAACGSGQEKPKQESQSQVSISHAMGTTILDTAPTRIVALDLSSVDATLSLGGELVGYTSISSTPEGRLPSYFGDSATKYASGAKTVGSLEEPSLEKITALKPDVIFSAKVRHEKLYPQLEKIAPTVFSDTTGPSWKDNLKLVARTLGKDDDAADLLASYEARATKIGDAVRTKLGRNPTVSVVRFLDGPTRLYKADTYAGVIVQDLGFNFPEAAQGDGFNTELSPEQIGQLDADWIFVATYPDSKGQGAKEKATFEASPLWRNLQGTVVDVDDAVWMSAVGLQGANTVLDNVAETFGVPAN